MKLTSLSYVPTPFGLINDAYDSLQFFFPQVPLESLKNTEKQIQFLSGFQPV